MGDITANVSLGRTDVASFVSLHSALELWRLLFLSIRARDCTATKFLIISVQITQDFLSYPIVTFTSHTCSTWFFRYLIHTLHTITNDTMFQHNLKHIAIFFYLFSSDRIWIQKLHERGTGWGTEERVYDCSYRNAYSEPRTCVAHNLNK